MIISFKEFILFEHRDKITKIEKNNQLMMYRTRKKKEEPEFFIKYLESKPIIDNYEFKASSLLTSSKSIPNLDINYPVQYSVYIMSK